MIQRAVIGKQGIVSVGYSDRDIISKWIHFLT